MHILPISKKWPLLRFWYCNWPYSDFNNILINCHRQPEQQRGEQWLICTLIWGSSVAQFTCAPSQPRRWHTGSSDTPTLVTQAWSCHWLFPHSSFPLCFNPLPCFSPWPTPSRHRAHQNTYQEERHGSLRPEKKMLWGGGGGICEAIMTSRARIGPCTCTKHVPSSLSYGYFKIPGNSEQHTWMVC